ncbi:MAG TPA: hypothetical protein VFQ38_20725 [Longimicrobiales bacterium]|nr:hypothetical protein [Longimicrobiales bacterium]
MLHREAARKAIHAAAGTAAAGVVYFAPPLIASAVCLAALAVALLLELARLASPRVGQAFQRALHPMLRPSEARRLTGATTLALGIAATTLIFPRRFAVAGLLYAALGDAAGAIVGRALGKHCLPWSHKTIEGSGAVFLAASLVGWGAAGLSPAAASLAALAVALIEAAPLRIDDNLVLPLTGAAVAWIASFLPF